MDKETKTEIILKLNVPNKNGHIHTTKEAVKAIENQARPEPLYCHIDHATNLIIDMEKVAATVSNLRVEGDYMFGDVTMLATPAGKMIRDVSNVSEIAYRAWGHGVIDPITKEISDFTMCGVAILPAHAVA
jgi:hypothetical protein